MSYYLGQSAIPVKPVSRRTTWTRGMQTAIRKAYLQQGGRCPINRRGYPTSGIPVSTGRALRNPQFRAMTRANLGTWINTDMSLEPGQQLGGIADFFKVPALTSIFTPSVPSSVPVASAPSSSSIWNPIASVVELWNARPQVLKDIKVTVNPNTLMRTAQQVLKPGQVQSFVDKAAGWGLNLDYRGMPISGQTAGFGYQLAGINWQAYLPWIIGGGAVLLLLPMVMGRK